MATRPAPERQKSNQKDRPDHAANGRITAPEMVQTSPDKPPHPSYNYTSRGVKDNNILHLKSGDWEIIGAITLVALLHTSISANGKRRSKDLENIKT